MALPRQTSWTEIVRKFRALGWRGPLYGAKHPYMFNGTIKQRIPNPHGSDIHISLLKEILRQANISESDWESA